MGSDREAVRGILQSGYGDATQTVLDDRVASDILNGLRERGWASPAEVAAIIHAAGGDVLVTDRAMMHVYDDDLVLSVEEDFASHGKRLRTRRVVKS